MKPVEKNAISALASVFILSAKKLPIGQGFVGKYL